MARFSVAILFATLLAATSFASPIEKRIDARELIKLPKGYKTPAQFCKKLPSICSHYAKSVHDKDPATSTCEPGYDYDHSKGTVLINCYTVNSDNQADILTPNLIKHEGWKVSTA